MTHNIIAYFPKYDWLCHLATFIIVILCVIQGFKIINFLASADIKPFGHAYLFPQEFLFSISLLFVNKYHYFIEAYMHGDATLMLNFEKLKPAIFLNFHYRLTHHYTLSISKLMQMICRGSKLWQKSTCSVITFSQTHSSVFFRLKTV